MQEDLPIRHAHQVGCLNRLRMSQREAQLAINVQNLAMSGHLPRRKFLRVWTLWAMGHCGM